MRGIPASRWGGVAVSLGLARPAAAGDAGRRISAAGTRASPCVRGILTMGTDWAAALAGMPPAARALGTPRRARAPPAWRPRREGLRRNHLGADQGGGRGRLQRPLWAAASAPLRHHSEQEEPRGWLASAPDGGRRISATAPEPARAPEADGVDGVASHTGCGFA